MINRTSPIFKELVLVGGGHSNIQIIKRFTMNPVVGLRLTLISDVTHAPYSGMLPGFMAGKYEFDEIHFDLRKICERAGCRFICSSVIGVDSDKKEIVVNERGPIKFDLASINVGISPAPLNLQGQDLPNFIPLKPISRLLDQWQDFIKQIKENSYNPSLNLAVIGGGAGGCEVAVVISERLKKMKIEAKVSLYARNADLMANHSKRTQKLILESMKQLGVDVFTAHEAIAFDGKEIRFSESPSKAAHFVFCATQAEAPQWFRNTNLPLDKDGFIRVGQDLRVVNTDGVFATGDCISLEMFDLPKAGVFAVREGPILYENLRRSLLAEPLKKYFPQKRFLTLLNAGFGQVLASWGSFSMRARIFWWIKDFIDRRFMKKFKSVPLMENSKIKDVDFSLVPSTYIANSCGGCGSKIAGGLLRNVLSKLKDFHPTLASEDFSRDDASILELPEAGQLVHTVDAIKAFIDDPFLTGQIATEHALNDIYAMGARPTWASAIIGLPRDSPKVTEEELFQILAGVGKQLVDSDVRLVGGHTYETESLTIGLSLLSKNQANLVKKSGMRSKDSLILTRSLGTGAIFKANMKGESDGRYVDAALKQMSMSQRAILSIVQKFDISALTDVTGFGLAGHLLEMLADSALQADLEFTQLPKLEGFRPAFEMGHQSYLATENRTNYQGFVEADSLQDWQSALLYDPQTAGGFLLTLSEAFERDCILELKKFGFKNANCIGRISPQKSAKKIFF